MTSENKRTSGNSHVQLIKRPVYQPRGNVKLRPLQGIKFRSNDQDAGVRMTPDKLVNSSKSGSADKGYAEYLSFAELAAYASVCVNTLKKWAKLGMSVYKVGGVLRVKRTEFDVWMQQFRNGTSKPDLAEVWDQVMEEV